MRECSECCGVSPRRRETEKETWSELRGAKVCAVCCERRPYEVAMSVRVVVP